MQPVDSVDQLIAEWAQERPDLDASPLAVVARLVRLSTLAIRQADAWLGPLGLSWESFSLLVTLRRAGEPFQRRPSELLAESLLSSGAVTNRIDRVEAAGLVERLRDPNDRRGVIVQLTPRGRELADRAIEQHLLHWKELLSGLSGPQHKALTGLLAQLLADMELAADLRQGAGPL